MAESLIGVMGWHKQQAHCDDMFPNAPSHVRICTVIHPKKKRRKKKEINIIYYFKKIIHFFSYRGGNQYPLYAPYFLL